MSWKLVNNHQNISGFFWIFVVFFVNYTINISPVKKSKFCIKKETKFWLTG